MIGLLLMLALVGLIVYLIITFIPMPVVVRTVILVFTAIFMIMYLLNVIGFRDIPVPSIR